MALPKFKGTLLLKSLVASCVLISSVGAESAAPTSPPPSPPCGDYNTDPDFCAAELTSSAELSEKCKEDLFYEKCKGSCFFCPAPLPPPPPSPSPPPSPCGDTDPDFCAAELTSPVELIQKCKEGPFYEKCKGTCGYCPGAGMPPPSPPPSPWSPPPSAPACSDKGGVTCKKKKCDRYPLGKKRKCKKTCDLCGPLPPSSPPPPTNCAGLADETECTIKVERCQKKPPKSMRKCQKNCKKDGKKKPPLCEKTCCELGF